MAATFFPRLFEPGEIRGLRPKNRIVMPAMHTNLGSVDDGISERGIDFYVARARGGFGMVGVGIIDSHPFDFSSSGEMLLQNARHVAVHRGMVDRLHEHGAVAFAQIGIRRVWPLREVNRQRRLSEVPASLVREMVDDVVASAVRAREAGYDAVDLLGNGWGGISIFLSRVFNDRDDDWGGDEDRRRRFPLAMAEGIRRACGPDLPVFFRMHGGEFAPGGYGVTEACRIASAMEAAGVCFFNVTGGSHATRVPVLTANVPRGAYAFAAREIRRAVRGAVAAGGRVNEPVSAEEILRGGWADYVSLGRAALADPDWPNKVQAGELAAVRRCIACNECMDIATVAERPIRCLVNPRAGRIDEARPLAPAGQPKRVLVVGGGCTGLQAALTAAERGHRVTLVERRPVLGGQWLVSYAPPGRAELLSFLQWLVTAVKAAGVEIRLNTEANAALVAAERPDVLIVAAGAKPRRPGLPGEDLPHVVFAEDILAGRREPGRRVVVIGGGGVGVETAQFLRSHGRVPVGVRSFFEAYGDVGPGTLEALQRDDGPEVTIVGRNRRLGVGLGAATRWVLLDELRHAGVRTMTETRALEITAEGVRVQGADGRETLLPADTVVLASGYEPSSEVYDRLRGLAPQVYQVGDAVSVDHATEGIGRAMEVALEI